jgi:CDP-glucose 4,6-dehydratase
VIGGGDWSQDRLIPDIIRSLSAGEAPSIRAPHAVRPWQHVLEALRGYVLVAERLLAGERRFAQAWNFGPFEDDAQPVSYIVDHMVASWGGKRWEPASGDHLHEAGLLRLDSSKARGELGWRPVLGLTEALNWIVLWHQAFARGEDARDVTIEQIKIFAARSQSALPHSASKAAAAA